MYCPEKSNKYGAPNLFRWNKFGIESDTRSRLRLNLDVYVTPTAEMKLDTVRKAEGNS